ncbi:DivIVA domain-containing protein [Streptomyces albus]|uniref:DivIVA domain-containing protein n=1 Tax=Streptomyces sp. PHES57 TaxID=2872626 RepID=UPI000B283BCF
MFVFLLISLVVVVAAVTLAIVGSGDGSHARERGATGGLADVPPDLLDEPLPAERPVTHADVAGLRLAIGLRGYRMDQVDDVLDRLGAELAERDARIAELESSLAGAQAVAMGRTPATGREPARGPAADPDGTTAPEDPSPGPAPEDPSPPPAPGGQDAPHPGAAPHDDRRAGGGEQEAVGDGREAGGDGLGRHAGGDGLGQEAGRDGQEESGR